MKKKITRKKIVLFFIGVIASLIALYILGYYHRKSLAKIEKDGVTTIGTIINKGYGQPYSSARWEVVYDIDFEFNANGKRIVCWQRLKDESEYWYATVGMKYKVKYLPDRLNKKWSFNEKSFLYLNEPIVSEYDSIDKELERIERLKENDWIEPVGKRLQQALPKLSHKN